MNELPLAVREQIKEDTNTLLSTILPKGETLTKSHIAEVIYEQYGLPKRFCKDIVDLFFQEALNTLIRGEELKLSNFGVFSIKHKGARPGRNPKSGVSAVIKARQVVSFHASGQLKNMVVDGLREEAAQKHIDSLKK